MWKSIEERGSPQMTIWCMRIACWIRKVTNTHSQVVRYLLLLHCNSGYMNVPQCYVIACLDKVSDSCENTNCVRQIREEINSLGAF
jgi:hypothetical protein